MTARHGESPVHPRYRIAEPSPMGCKGVSASASAGSHPAFCAVAAVILRDIDIAPISGPASQNVREQGARGLSSAREMSHAPGRAGQDLAGAMA
jgi:hypothetical protein